VELIWIVVPPAVISCSAAAAGSARAVKLASAVTSPLMTTIAPRMHASSTRS
jgi:hypothetical protein